MATFTIKKVDNKHILYRGKARYGELDASLDLKEIDPTDLIDAIEGIDSVELSFNDASEKTVTVVVNKGFKNEEFEDATPGKEEYVEDQTSEESEDPYEAKTEVTAKVDESLNGKKTVVEEEIARRRGRSTPLTRTVLEQRLFEKNNKLAAQLERRKASPRL